MEELPKGAGLDGVQPDTLAKRLAQGPLPLGFALQCATDVATSLRTLHEEGRMHGSVNANCVLVTNAGARLLPPNGHARYTVPGADVSAFGALLHEMLTGAKPSPRAPLALPAMTSRNTEKGIEIAATRLASKCLRSTSNSALEMPKVLTEVRLLSVQARMRDKPATGAPLAPLAPMARSKPSPALAKKSDRPIAPKPKGSNAQRSFTTDRPDSFLTSKEKDEDAVDPASKGSKCPSCGAAFVYPSRPRTWFETMLAAWGGRFLRCHRCLRRYVVVLGRFNFSRGALKAKRQSIM